MDDKIIALAITVITSVVTASITYIVSVRTGIRNRELELKREQAFKYFLPLKFIADELYHRLAHIEKKIVEKRDSNVQLPQHFENKDFKWYFTDWNDPENPGAGAGGYFLTTTIFMQTQLYQRINTLLKEYPYLEVKIDKDILYYINLAHDEQIVRCYENTISHKHTRKWINIEEFVKIKGKIKLEKLIRRVRLAAIMKGGIPYGLQPAFGQFIEKSNNGKVEQINYEEFVRMLMDTEQREKFSPLHGFYSGVVDKDFNINEKKLIKMRALMLSLLLFRHAELV